jgi:hypothetical protein
VIFSGTGAIPKVPQPILSQGQNAGTITSAVQDVPTDGATTASWIGLGLVKRVFANPDGLSTMSFTVDNQPVKAQLRNPIDQENKMSI